jgi:hypothetical protein
VGQTANVYGSYAGISYVAVGLAVALVIALFFAAAPLLAVVIAVIAVAGMVVLSMLRRRAGDEPREAEPPSEPPSTGRPSSPAGRMKSPTGSRSGGAPASGEG